MGKWKGSGKRGGREKVERGGKSSVQLGECGHAVAFVKRRERHAMGVKRGVEREE